MRCRVVICAACCTRVKGVNHCHACLKVLGGQREETGGRNYLWPVLATLLLGVAWMMLFGLCWGISGKLAP
jgi:hypothetical protein